MVILGVSLILAGHLNSVVARMVSTRLGGISRTSSSRCCFSIRICSSSRAAAFCDDRRRRRQKMHHISRPIPSAHKGTITAAAITAGLTPCDEPPLVARGRGRECGWYVVDARGGAFGAVDAVPGFESVRDSRSFAGAGFGVITQIKFVTSGFHEEKQRTICRR